MEKIFDDLLKEAERSLNNEKIVIYKLNELKDEWKKEDRFSFHALQKNIGIGAMHTDYIEVNQFQDVYEEYAKIKRFLRLYIEYYSKINNIALENLDLEFINYGKTQLVYVLTEKSGKRVTLLVKQPAVKFGDIKEEMINLLQLKKKDKNVVAPIDYFTLDDQELYVTPYINQARCVASYGTWGMYIPEPFYRFESFTSEQESIVNTCIIAKIVGLYDHEKEEGICSCKIGGGDFMLPKGWELESPTIENTLNNLYLIAARKKINCPYEEYLKIIRDEFSRSTILEQQQNLLINLRGRVPMNINDIEEGIKLAENVNIKRKAIKQLHK